MSRVRSIAAGSFIAGLVAFGPIGAMPAFAGEDLGQLLGNGQMVGAKDLATQRGGTDTPVQQDMSATVDGNLVGPFTHTGSNAFGGISGSDGMFTVFQNTGNNVAMQSETVLNINIK
jgi:hypothetical protein